MGETAKKNGLWGPKTTRITKRRTPIVVLADRKKPERAERRSKLPTYLHKESGPKGALTPQKRGRKKGRGKSLGAANDKG